MVEVAPLSGCSYSIIKSLYYFNTDIKTLQWQPLKDFLLTVLNHGANWLKFVHL